MDELVFYEKDLWYYTVLATELAPWDNVSISWKMKFYGAKSIARVGLGIAFMSPRGDTLCYDFHLEFETTNNVSKYGMILLDWTWLNIKDLIFWKSKVTLIWWSYK